MLKQVALGFSLCAVLSIGAATLAAPQQDRPGVMTQARVFIENRPEEPVPVAIQRIAVPVDVRAAGTVTVANAAGTPIEVRLARQPWEYRTLTMQVGGDLQASLAGVGAEGWEITGIQFVNQAGATVLLKRPR